MDRSITKETLLRFIGEGDVAQYGTQDPEELLEQVMRALRKIKLLPASSREGKTVLMLGSLQFICKWLIENGELTDVLANTLNKK